MLSSIDLSLKLDRETYVREMTRYQVQLRELAYQVYQQQRPVVIVYEGWDAAGKGGNIRRLTEKMDPRSYTVYPISAPSGEDKTHHYLYRFWRRLPERGHIGIFDRSWYGRILVERVEEFCTQPEWKRSYREINSFERQLHESGAIIVKYWVHISRDEQLKRFEERKRTGYKAWKLTDEDWRNRAKWGDYEAAANEMLLKTSTFTAPWTIVEGNDKWWARVKALSTMVETLSRELNYNPFDPLAKPKTKKKAKPKHPVPDNS